MAKALLAGRAAAAAGGTGTGTGAGPGLCLGFGNKSDYTAKVALFDSPNSLFVLHIVFTVFTPLE